MTVHLIEAWENGEPGSNHWISVCGESGRIYGSNYKEDVSCEACLRLVNIDEFAALPQTEWEAL